MSAEIQKLNDNDAVNALSLVVDAWMSHRGREVYLTFHGTLQKAADSYSTLPAWARENPIATKESGDFARRMLEVLIDAKEDEVREWTRDALKVVYTTKAHVDPITLSIVGAMLIGAILAARVRRIGPVEFYEGVPENLAKVIKAGAAVAGST